VKSDFRNLFWNAPARNPFFTGRATHLEIIRQALTQTASAAPTQPQAISGLGGIGKTQTAIEYVYRYRNGYAAILWSGADSRHALVSGFAALANLLNLPEKEEQDLSVVAAAVRRWLASNSGWLLVLDNVEDLALIDQFVPVGAAGHLLITTRLHATGEFAAAIELKQMELEEGALFLLRRAKVIPKDRSLEATGEVDQALARQICAELDGLPLALNQAGAFIEETPSTLAEYLALYRTGGAVMRARRGKLAPHHPSVTITFSLAFARVAEANSAAAELVGGCAFLAPAAIPEEIFTEAGGEWGEPIAGSITKPLAWAEAIEKAGRFALISRDAKHRSLHIHRLVQEVLKDDMDVPTRTHWAGRAVHALARVFPPPEFQNWIQCERLIAHAREAARLVEEYGLGSVAAARLLNDAGGYLEHRAQYAEGKVLLERALTIFEKELGPRHAESARTLNNIATLDVKQGRPADAEPLLRRALAIMEEALGSDHLDVATGFNNLAVFYDNQDRSTEAEPLHLRALAVTEEAVGPNHPRTGLSLNSLAVCYGNQGRHEEAERLYLRARSIMERVLPGHPDTATVLFNLAELYRGKSHADAEPLHQRALAIREQALGPNHPETASSLNSVASCYQTEGRSADAERLFRRALAIRHKTFNPNEPAIAYSLSNLAGLYYGERRYAEAEPLSRRALTILEEALGPTHPKTVQMRGHYATLLRKLDRETEAKEVEAQERTGLAPDSHCPRCG
jgi:tetratricopeptide (TPR) repeat protein